MQDKEVIDSPEENPGSEGATPASSDRFIYLPVNAPASSENSKTDDRNWLGIIATIQHLKELLVIFSTIGFVGWLLIILSGFISSLKEIFTEAVKLHSAPITVVKSFDWHVVLIATTLIVAIAAIIIVVLKSVFNTAKDEKKASDGVSLKDMPLGEILTTIAGFFKK